jgi:hypothetical protein
LGISLTLALDKVQLRNSKFNPFGTTSLKGSKMPPDETQWLMAVIIERFSEMKMS